MPYVNACLTVEKTNELQTRATILQHSEEIFYLTL